MIFYLPDYVKNIISVLENNGFEAFCVGGCVRDTLLGKTPGDYDVTTNALPGQVMGIFEHTVPTGLKHGTVTVVDGKNSCEVTTYRTDGKYENSRRPESVTFVGNIREDLSRRDFTVNAMAYGKDGLVDLFGGADDIKNGILRAVGDPDVRFGEDALRILRLFRFAAVLGFDAEQNTLDAALGKSVLLENISRERIAAELLKLITADFPEKLMPLTTYGGLRFLGISGADISPLKNLPKRRELRFYFFSVLSDADPEALADALKLDNRLKKYCAEMKTLKNEVPKDAADIKRVLNRYSESAVRDTLLLGGSDLSLLENILKSNEPYRISDLKITGEDLKARGFVGEEIGRKLDEILNAVIEDPNADVESIISH